jgi:hypothetical protein
MARHTRTNLGQTASPRRPVSPRLAFSASRRDAATCRRLRFESLEDRRMLSIIADNFGPTFAQVSRSYSADNVILSVDSAGNFAIFYEPNTELGYIDPQTGDLLTLSKFPGTSSVPVFDAVVGGSGTVDAGLTNISQLVGLQYSNGQTIATDATTLFHTTGSSMLNGTIWKYASGATLRSSGNYVWGNSDSMKSGNTYKQNNGATLRNTAGSMFYGTNTAFINSITGELFYPASVTLRNATGVYSYETGGQLDSNNVIYYPSGATMVDQTGNVFNEDGSPSTTPFSQLNSFTNSEVTTTVSNVDSLTTIVAKQTVGNSPAAYVTRIHLIYRVMGDYNSDGAADAGDYVLWRKNNGTNSVLANDNNLGTPIGQSHYDLWRANFGIATNIGAGAGAGLAMAETESFTTTHSLLSYGTAENEVQAAAGNELSVVFRRVKASPSVAVFDQSETDLQLSTVVADWQPPTSTTNDLDFGVPAPAVNRTPQATDPTLDTVDDAFALLALGL